ncbi:TRAP transporter small permease [Alphaproteobacteria bacterium LSUCC0684]
MTTPMWLNIKTLVQKVDEILGFLSDLFHSIAIFCLMAMLLGTAFTIIARPLEISFYWIWPWTIQFFVWMCFFGFYPVYRRRADISISFIIEKFSEPIGHLSKIFIEIAIILVMLLIIVQLPIIFESQVGPIDGVITPWGELERYTLSIPMSLSCGLILINSLLEVIKLLIHGGNSPIEVP